MDLLRSRNGRIGAAAVLLIVIAGGGWLAFGGSPKPSPVAVPTATPTPQATASPTPEPTPSASPKAKADAKVCPLDGLPLAHPAMLKHPALAVQIENHPLARPVTNLGLADMVIEATVEGDVTRYTGIFLCRKTEGALVGPERSGRYYSIDLWQDMHVLPYMFGAGGEGIRRYRKAHMPYVNGITGQWPYYVRSHDRPAPHNLYTDLQLVRDDFGHNARLDKLARHVGKLRPPFRFDAHARRPTGRQVHSVQFWTNSYWNFGWEWDRQLGAWRRNEDGHEHIDAGTHRVLSAKSVIVQYVHEDVVYGPHDPGGYPRRYHHLVGKGDATLYVAGRAIAVHWSRPTPKSVTRWTYVHGGSPVVLPPGVVWREILPIYTTVHQR
ncbi:MAG TPA: DUF3048 domain-containing protein [Candidatus Limnocylindria bacterium]|nr:DUF3048 domain-containing protein [Candidatus Limnocylindria bacterium]